MRDLIDKLNVCEILADIYPTDGEKVVGVERIDKAYEAVLALPSAQSEHTSNNDCNGCKFVGCYDTCFPCANCIRKDKDYYEPEE